jgi:hypothetical protein
MARQRRKDAGNEKQSRTAADGRVLGLRSGPRRSRNEIRGQALDIQHEELRREARDAYLALNAAIVLDDIRDQLSFVRKYADDPALVKLLDLIDEVVALRPIDARTGTEWGWNGRVRVLAAKIVGHASGHEVTGRRRAGGRGRRPQRAVHETAVWNTFIELWLDHTRSQQIGEAPALRAIGVNPSSYLRHRRRRGGAAGREQAQQGYQELLDQLMRAAPRRDDH